MKKICLLALSFLSVNSQAQTLAANMMPDGSQDIFIGLAVAAAPRYEGASKGNLKLVPILQMQWSNGIFVSDLYTAGMHLSNQPGIEYGPLLQYQPGRRATTTEKTYGVEDINDTINVGGFLNIYLNPNLRLKSSLLHATGNGMLYKLDLQQSFRQIVPHHTLSISAGSVWANRQYTQKYFGIDPDLSTANLSHVGETSITLDPNNAGSSGINGAGKIESNYVASGGVSNLHLGANWNWELDANWLLTSGVSAVRLHGNAAASPVVSKRNYMTVHTGLAYRF